MAILRGLSSIKAHDDALAQKKAERENKTVWFTIKSGQKIEVVFLQELDPSSERFSEKNGTGLLAQEHFNPSKAEFFKRTVCTKDEEHDFQCWGCEQNAREWSKVKQEDKGKEGTYSGQWGAKTHLYINVLVRPEGEDPYVAVLQRKRSDQTFVDDLLELAGEEGFISNRTVILSRKGEGFKTKHSMAVKDEDAGVNVEDYDLFDLDSIVREVPYEQQAARLGMGAVLAPRETDVESPTLTDPEDSEEDDWL
jgi:hypothetical protein